MKKTYLTNAFSFNMVDQIGTVEFDMLVDVVTSSAMREHVEDSVKEGSLCISMSNQATCDLLNAIIGGSIAPEKGNVDAKIGDTVLIMQYNGPRLYNGAKNIPEGGKVRFYKVQIAEAA